MFKMMLSLALLLTTVVGCHHHGNYDGRGRDHQARGRNYDNRGHSGASSVHTHGGGCGHVYRGGVWVVGH